MSNMTIIMSNMTRLTMLSACTYRNVQRKFQLPSLTRRYFSGRPAGTDSDTTELGNIKTCEHDDLLQAMCSEGYLFKSIKFEQILGNKVFSYFLKIFQHII